MSNAQQVKKKQKNSLKLKEVVKSEKQQQQKNAQ